MLFKDTQKHIKLQFPRRSYSASCNYQNQDNQLVMRYLTIIKIHSGIEV